MSEAAASSRGDYEAKIVARAWADESFRERLKTDPRAAVAEETGSHVEIEIEVQPGQGLPRHPGEPGGRYRRAARRAGGWDAYT